MSAYGDALAETTLDSNETNWDGFTIRQIIPASSLALSGGAVRLTIEAAEGAGTDIQALYVGQAASSGDAYDFDDDPVQVTVGGNGKWIVPAGETLICDPVLFALDEAENLIVSAVIGNDPNSVLRYKARSGFDAYYKAGSDASTVDATGYSSSGTTNRQYLVTQIEVTLAADGGRHVISQRSGFRVKAEDLVKDPDARIWVHRDEVDEVNPQEFVRGRRDRQRKRNTYPEPADVFLTTNQVSRNDL